MARAVICCLLLCGCDSVFGLAARDAGRDPPTDVSGDGADAPAGQIQFIESHSVAVTQAPKVNSLTFGAVEQGDLVVVAVATFGASPLLSVSDSTGMPYAEPSPSITTAGGATLHMLYRANVSAFAPLAVTAVTTATGTQEVSMSVHLYRGASTTALDQYDSKLGTSKTPTSSVVVNGNGEVIVAALVHDNTIDTSVGAGFALREVATDESNGFTPLATEDQLDAPVGPTSATFRLPVSAAWAVMAMSFKPLTK